MALEQWYYLGELVGVLAIIGSLLFVGIQIRQTNRVNSATARHSISDHAMTLITFQATHADRLAAVRRADTLAPGDAIFLENVNRMTFQLAENYHHQHDLGLLPDDHWRGFEKFIAEFVRQPRVRQYWDDFGDNYGGGFALWIGRLMTAK